MRVMVTGGLGFIGSHFVRILCRRGEEVINVDKMTYAACERNIESLPADAVHQLVVSDICDSTELIMDCRPDMVVNFAAETHVDRSIQSAGPFVHSNIDGVRVLLDACRASGVKRFLQVSTDEVYGSLEEGGIPWSEEDPLLPNSPYSASKAAAELLVRSYHRTYGMDVVITRSSNNFGPCQYPEKLIPVVVNKAMRGEKIPVYGNGTNVRDWLFVEDNCEGIWLAAQKAPPGETYNLGADSEMSNLTLVKSVLRIMDKPHDLIEFVEDRPGHDVRYSIDSAKAHRDLGWRPKASFGEALRQTIAWYEENDDWWG